MLCYIFVYLSIYPFFFTLPLHCTALHFIYLSNLLTIPYSPPRSLPNLPTYPPHFSQHPVPYSIYKYKYSQHYDITYIKLHKNINIYPILPHNNKQGPRSNRLTSAANQFGCFCHTYCFHPRRIIGWVCRYRPRLEQREVASVSACLA